MLSALTELKCQIAAPAMPASASRATDRRTRLSKNQRNAIDTSQGNPFQADVDTWAAEQEAAQAAERFNVIKTFNDMFGDIDWDDADRVARTVAELPAKVAEDAAYRNAMANSDRQNARIISSKRTPFFEVEVLSKAQLCCRRVVGKARRV